MRLVIARCSVDYAGRLAAHLPMAPRLILLKADGSLAVHADDRAYKPLNWLSPPCTLTEGDDGVWTVTNKVGERLVIRIEEVLHDSTHELGVDPGLVKDGVEAHLQELLAENVEIVGPGYTLVRREYPTAIGPVDILCCDPADDSMAVAFTPDGEGVTHPTGDLTGEVAGGGSPKPRHWAVEIKRRATISAVEQLTRYLEYLNRDPAIAPVGGVLAAQTIAPQARVLAEDRGMRCLLLDYDELRGMDNKEDRLF